MQFSAEGLGTFLGLAAPLLNLLGVDTRNITLEKAEDFAALKEFGRQIMELGEAGEKALGDGVVDGADVAAIFKEAKDLPSASKALLGEVRDQGLDDAEGE